jgi:hypothetical protein
LTFSKVIGMVKTIKTPNQLSLRKLDGATCGLVDLAKRRGFVGDCLLYFFGHFLCHGVYDWD